MSETLYKIVDVLGKDVWQLIIQNKKSRVSFNTQSKF